MSALLIELNSQRAFVIIFHSDAVRAALAEKPLLCSDASQCANLARSRKASHPVTLDWVDIENQSSISITPSVISVEHQDCILCLLGTPGHEVFSEDTYSIPATVDAALMVIGSTKGAIVH